MLGETPGGPQDFPESQDSARIQRRPPQIGPRTTQVYQTVSGAMPKIIQIRTSQGRALESVFFLPPTPNSGESNFKTQ